MNSVNKKTKTKKNETKQNKKKQNKKKRNKKNNSCTYGSIVLTEKNCRSTCY